MEMNEGYFENDLFDEAFASSHPMLGKITKKELGGKDTILANFRKCIVKNSSEDLVYMKEKYRQAFTHCARRLVIGEYVEEGLIKDSFIGYDLLDDENLNFQFERFYKGIIIQSYDMQSMEYKFHWLKDHEVKKCLKLAPYMLTPIRVKDILNSDWYKNLPES